MAEFWSGTNASVFVGYVAFGPWRDSTPAIGEEVILRDGEAPVEVQKDLQSSSVSLRPTMALIPNHTYQVF